MRTLIILLLLGSAFFSNAQDYEEAPQPELSAGIKVLNGEITYGQKSFYRTNPKKIGLQPTLRYDFPVKLFTIRETPTYIDLVGQVGLLYYSGEKFEYNYNDPLTGALIHEKSGNATYVPVYFGFYNVTSFALGVEIFYWKGLGSRDLWGTKILSLGYNGKKFRVNGAVEMYAQVQDRYTGGVFFSFDFLWKLRTGDEY